MPLINKAAVIFVSQGLQTHLWYVTWQHKLAKSACSYQISKVLIPSHATTKLKVKGAASPLPRGKNRGERSLPVPWFLSASSPSSSSPQDASSDRRPRRSKASANMAPSPKGCKKGWEIVSLELKGNVLFSFPYLSPPHLPQPFSPFQLH